MSRARPCLALVLALAAACQTAAPAIGTTSASAPSAVAAPPAASGGAAVYVVASFTGVFALDGDGRVIGQLLQLPPLSFASGATLHPTGGRLAFVLTSGNLTGAASSNGFGSDIYVMNRDGSGLRKLVEHEVENTFYSGLAFDPTGRFLYFQRRAAVTRDSSPSTDDAIERLDLETGGRRRILVDGTDPTVSPDGRTLVYVHLVRGQVDTLWTADADGGNTRPLFKVKDRFFYLQTPRFAPTGCQVVFSGAGRTVVNRSWPGSRSAHLGIPSELYLSPCDGSSITTIGETYDDVTPVWSPDGSRIGYALGGAVSLITVATREVRKLAQGDAFSFGDLVWLH